jgi:transposase
MIPTITIGVDVCKKNLDCTLFQATTQHLVWTDRFANDPEGIATLLSRAPIEAAFVAEPTGRYGHAFIQAAQKQGRTVLLAPNRQARLYLRSMNPRAKNDRLDSRGLARFATAKELLPYTLKSQSVEEIDQLLSVRKELSGTITRLSLQSKELPLVADQVAPIVAELRARLAEIDKKIAQVIHGNPSFEVARRLQQIPGVGPVTAAAVASRLVAKGFASADAFVAYVGLDITVSQSGESRGKGRLSKQGDAELRRLLYCCAQSTLRCKQSPFQSLYARQRAKGLASTKALCVVARKMARVCWSIAAHGTSYDPDRVFAPRVEKPAEQADVALLRS